MTVSDGTNQRSLRFALHEVLSGMLATIEGDTFTDDVHRLAGMFEGLATRFPLFAPMAAGVDPAAVSHALQKLEDGKFIEHTTERFVLTPAGRAHCISSKRTLFNPRDIEQLAAAARVFDTL